MMMSPLSVNGYGSSAVTNSSWLNISYDWVSQGLPLKKTHMNNNQQANGI